MPAYIQHYISCNKLHRATPTFFSPTAALILQQGNVPIFQQNALAAMSSQPPTFKVETQQETLHSAAIVSDDQLTYI